MKLFLISLITFVCISCGNSQEIPSITTQELKQLMKETKLQLLDVRTPSEIAEGSIEGAISIDYYDTTFTDKAVQMLTVKKPVYVYCRSGKRSAKAVSLLKEKGFLAITVLGGYTEWKKE